VSDVYALTAIVLSEKTRKLLINNLEVKKKCLPLQSQFEKRVERKFFKRQAQKNNLKIFAKKFGD
jgi:hypothetical protein